MGELVILMPFVLAVASFVVVPFLGWGMADPRGQWEQIQRWRNRDGRLHQRMETRHRAVNGVALLLWLALVVWLFQTVG